MREIKFRAFNKKTQKMEYYDPFFVGPSRLPPLDGWDGTRVPMQFTGLTDKNGKEIYEGDLIRMSDEVWEIVWSNNRAAWLPREWDKPHHNEFWGRDLAKTRYEVIGNVWENPDLLATNK